MRNLAIVLPVYKREFLQRALESLVQQTCKDFTVYIGDDKSPEELELIVKAYEDKLDLVYVRFTDNLGGKDLVGQWARCVALTQREPWIWLFSDDDIMGARCVELFYKALEQGYDNDVFHFDTVVIDSQERIVRKSRPYPKSISSIEFYKAKGSALLDCFVVEFIFSRRIYELTGGFQNFDLAWWSDSATWVKMGNEKGIRTIGGDTVKWRLSDKNISSVQDQTLAVRKIRATIDYLAWGRIFFLGKANVRFSNILFLLRAWHHYVSVFSRSDVKELATYACEKRVFSRLEKALFCFFYPLLKILLR